MKAIVLAAGRGSRLGSLTNDNPKCLTELFGKSLIEWQVKALNEAGINEIAIVRGYKKEKINIKNATYFDNDIWDKTNMVMSLYKADEWLQKYECIISYSDIIYKSEVIDLLKIIIVILVLHITQIGLNFGKLDLKILCLMPKVLELTIKGSY